MLSFNSENNHSKNKLSEKEKKFAYCFDKFGNTLDHEAYNLIIGVSKKQQEKVISLCKRHPVSEFSVVFDIPEEILNKAKVDMKKRSYARQKQIEKLSSNKPKDEKYLPFGHDFSEK